MFQTITNNDSKIHNQSSYTIYKIYLIYVIQQYGMYGTNQCETFDYLLIRSIQQQENYDLELNIELLHHLLRRSS